MPHRCRAGWDLPVDKGVWPRRVPGRQGLSDARRWAEWSMTWGAFAGNIYEQALAHEQVLAEWPLRRPAKEPCPGVTAVNRRSRRCRCTDGRGNEWSGGSRRAACRATRHCQAHPADIRCGQAAGTWTCAATCGQAGDAAFAGARRDSRIARFPDLLQYGVTPDRRPPPGPVTCANRIRLNSYPPYPPPPRAFGSEALRTPRC